MDAKNLIDANSTIDLIKLKFYNEWLYTAHVYAEGDSLYHKNLTTEVCKKYIDPLQIPKDAKILDMGCGPGYFLDEMKQREYTDVTGVTLSPEDIKLCEERGHKVKSYDLSFLPQVDGYYDESVDFIFCRHALEHSPYPIFTLMEYNRVLKQNSFLYIEVPQPDCERQHEYNSNHYSIFGANQLSALLLRTGFDVKTFENLEFDLIFPQENGESKTVREKFYCIVAIKRRPLDIK